MHNVHIPFPDQLYLDLRSEAKTLKKPTTELIRTAVLKWLTDRKREVLDKKIANYAAVHAGSAADLDPDLEAASIEHLIDMDSHETR